MIQPISIVIPFCIHKTNVFLWTQIRDSSDELNGLLEFPGGKIEAQETPHAAAVREVQEETNVSIVKDGLIKFKNYSYQTDDKTILLMVFLIKDVDQRFSKSGYYKLDELVSMEDRVPPANKEILLDLREHFGNI